MNSSPTLSICIATLNRGAFIGATLDSIISQANEDVELVIVDGASTDNTQEIVKSYQNKFSKLRYIRLPVKGGVDQDYSRAVELAQGEYCWLFTDDDIMKPGAVQAVLNAIRDNYELIIVNAEVKDAALSRVLEDRRLRISKDTVYRRPDFERFFVETSEYLSFIGCVVIKRSLWSEREKERYFGTVFVHVGVIFQEPLEGDILVLADPLISIRYGNALWTPKSFEIAFFKWPDLIWSFPFFSESSKRRIAQPEPWRSLKSLLMYRARGAFTLKEYRMMVVPRTTPGLQRLGMRLIAQLPGLLLNSGLIIYFRVFRGTCPKARIHLVDLVNSRFYYKNYLSESVVKG